jgi:hypothetical protein
MNANDRNIGRDRHPEDAVDERIRRRFASCESLPLFPDRPPPMPPGFFQPPHTGEQLRLLDARRRGQPEG